MSMSLTSGVQENSKWEPDEREAESIESRSSAAASVSISSFMSEGSEKRSVNESRSANVESAVPAAELIIKLGSCLMRIVDVESMLFLEPPTPPTIDCKPKWWQGDSSMSSDSTSGSGVNVATRPGSVLMVKELRLSSDGETAEEVGGVTSPETGESPLATTATLADDDSSYMVRLAGESGMSDDGLDGTLAGGNVVIVVV